MQLTHKINDKVTYKSVAADCTQLIDQQVAAKSGLSGLALKAAYGVAKGIGADYIPGAVQRLLPEILAALDPMWTKGVEQGDPVAYLSQNSDQAADVILSTTDARMEKKGGGIILSSYKKLRKSVKRDVAAAVPGLAQILGRYAS